MLLLLLLQHEAGAEDNTVADEPIPRAGHCRAALGKNVSVLIGREPGKCGHIFPGKDVSVLIGREAIFADRQASRNASLNAPFFPRTAPSDPPLGSGVCGAQSCLGAQEMVYFQPRAKARG